MFSLAFLCPATQAEDAPAKGGYEALVAGAHIERATFTSIRTPDGKHYLEIPDGVLGRDLLGYAEVAEAPAVLGGQGLGAMALSSGKELGHRAVRLDRHAGTLLVRDLETGLAIRPDSELPPSGGPQSDEDPGPCGCPPDPLRTAISNASILPILRALPIVATSPEGSIVVDADALFLAAIPSVDAKDAVPGATAMDPARSFVDDVRAQGRAVDATLTATYTINPAAVPPIMKSLLGSIESSAATIQARHSLLLLPDDPMRPRAYDSRVGFFNTAYHAPDKGGVQSFERHVITRFRLEKQDPEQAVSDPGKPIVFHMSEEIPEVWRPYVKRGVESWQRCFEHAGFSNAIVARPAPRDDPDWNAASLEHNVIRWIALPVKNAQGPKVIDPRTGEILAAHVVVWNDVIDAFADKYFVLASAVDEKASALPLPQEIRGGILEYAIMREVGHSIGLRHNFRASQAFTIEELRDPAFTANHGSVASVMSYGRMNYVAQPGDGVTDVMPRIGPYDEWAIHWGYAPVPGAGSMDAEAPVLAAWASEQAKDRMLPYAPEDGESLVFDPRTLRENLGDDRIQAARLGITNLERMIARLPEAVARIPHGRSARIRDLHRTALGMRNTWLLAASKQLCGFHLEAKDEDTPRSRVRLDRTLRQATLAFLLAQLESTEALVSPGVADAYPPRELATALVSQQVALLDAILDGRVFQAALHDGVLGREGGASYDYLTSVRSALFEEFDGGNASAVDPIRRTLQRHFVTRVSTLDEPIVQSDQEKLIARMLGEAPPTVHAHVQDLIRRVAAAGIR